MSDREALLSALPGTELPHGSGSFHVNLEQPFPNQGCVIMASGMGKRFGGNKLMAPFHGEPLIMRILRCTEGIFARRIVVTRHRDVADMCRDAGIETVLHDLPYRSDTVRLGLEALGDVESSMFCPADQPLLRPETVKSLCLCAADEKDRIWRTCFESRMGAPVIFPKWCFPELKALPEGKGGGILMQKYPEQVRTLPVRDMYELMDVDSPQDLAVLSER